MTTSVDQEEVIMQLNMTTFAARPVHYIDQALESLFTTAPRDVDLSVNLILGSEDRSHIRNYLNHPAIRIVPWDSETNPSLRLNCTLNKIRALRHGEEGPAVVCEDDILFIPDWFPMLIDAAHEMGDEEYILSLSVSRPTATEIRPLPGRHLVKRYPNFVLQGAQALYYPTRDLRNKVADYLTTNLKRGCGDDLIGRYARSHAALYATTYQLISHIGAISCFKP
jgi:hypothetical protein